MKPRELESYTKAYKYIKLIRIKNKWCIQNRFTCTTIGVIKYSIFANEFIYLPKRQYWHREIILSETNMQDIIKAIAYIKTL